MEQTMKTIAQPEFLESLSREARISLSSAMKRVREGSEEILIAPGFGVPDSEIADNLWEILDEVDITGKLREMEESNASKFGPRSIAKPWEERKDSLFAYFQHDTTDEVSLSTSSSYKRPLSLKKGSEQLVASSSSGLPWMRKKGVIRDKIVSEYIETVGKYPAVLYTRTQEDRKTRDVWGYPAADTLREICFYYPFLAVEKGLPHRSVLNGPDAVDESITRMLRMRPDAIYAVDFSAFDSSVRPSDSMQAFSWIASHFQAPYAAEIDLIAERFTTIGMMTPDGLLEGVHGVPSGSAFTNTVDSYVQWAAADYAMDCQIQGDDGVYPLHGRYMSESDLVEGFNEHGLQLNESKSFLSDGTETVYLQKYYHEKYPARDDPGRLGGVYPAFRAFLRLKYLERWTDFEQLGIKGRDFFSLRAVMILENCKHHPAFEELVLYAKSIDKYGLEFTDASVAPFSRALASRAQAGALQVDLKKGINHFEVVKFLRGS
jgi:hypothetical protein